MAQGMPAHITALYPFLRADRLTEAVLTQLADLCAQLPVLEITFRQTGRFPAVLYLEPEPADGLRQLTLTIAERWPQAPPYGGDYEEIIPHLTVAHNASDDVLAEIETAMLHGLPVQAQLTEVSLYVSDGARWRPRARLPFQARHSDG